MLQTSLPQYTNYFAFWVFIVTSFFGHAQKNSVVGQKSLVTRVFEEENVILAGVPAKIIKRDISWDRTPSSIWDKSNVK